MKPTEQLDFTNSHIKNKQLIVYYLYRILCKHKLAFIQAVTEEQINDIFMALNVAENNCYPLANKVMNDLNSLETIINAILSIFKTYSESESEGLSLSLKKLNTFITYKLADENRIIKDLAKIGMLVPNLSMPSIKPQPKEIDNMVGI